METIKSWAHTMRTSYISEESGIAKMSDGYTLSDLDVINGRDIEWEDCEGMKESIRYEYIMYVTKPNWAR